jgi:hypothetical protein
MTDNLSLSIHETGHHHICNSPEPEAILSFTNEIYKKGIPLLTAGVNFMYIHNSYTQSQCYDDAQELKLAKDAQEDASVLSYTPRLEMMQRQVHSIVNYK